MSPETEVDGAGDAELRFLDLDGVRTFVRLRGRDGVPLVLLHGVLNDGESWSGVAGPLASGRLLVIPDMPLHGRTETPGGFRPDPEGMTSWLLSLLDELGIEGADLLGISMGGALAIHFARRHPDRVRRLVLVDAANVVPLEETYGSFIQEMREKLEAAIGAGVVTSTSCWTEELGFEGEMTAAVPLCTDPIVMSVLEYLEARGIPFEQAMRGLDLLEPVGRDTLGAIGAPTLAIWGAEDPYFPAEAAVTELEGALPEGRVAVLDGVGHNPVSQRPGEFLELVQGFLG